MLLSDDPTAARTWFTAPSICHGEPFPTSVGLRTADSGPDRAEPGEILVSDRTMAKAQDVAAGDVVDEVTLKGVARPIKIYSLTRPTRPSQGDDTD